MNLDKLLQTLELAETELRSQYRRNGIISSNVLKDIIEAQDQVKNCSIPNVVDSCRCSRCGEQHRECLNGKMCYVCDNVTQGN